MESTIKYVGKCLLLTSEKENLLVVGDLHIGFEQSLNESGILVSRQMFNELIEDFENIFTKIRVGINVNDLKKKGGTIAEDEGNREIKIKLKKSEKEDRIVDKIVLLGDIKHDFGKISKL